MKVTTPLLGILLGLSVICPVLGAPIFPDAGENSWAQDAVATLAAKGLLEGYPDGTFKGDRSASRWEMAMIIARLLNQLEGQHVTLATKSELKQLQDLANNLRSELDALGARVNNLEEAVDSLESRVSNLERVSFYGSYKARFTAISLQNTGVYSYGTPGTVINYNDAVGSLTGAGGYLPADSIAYGLTMNTFVFDLLSVTDWSTGHPLLNGNSASHCLMLGAKFNPFGDFDAGVEFSAYSSNGNNLMSAFWGVPQPYWSNPVMANVGYNTNGNFDNSHKFYTKLALDNFWLKKRDGSFNLVFGSFKDDNFDSLVFTHQRNANAWDDYYAGCYGLLINGQIPINESSHLRWEAMATNLANNASSPDIAPEYYYETRAQGLNLEWLFNDENGSLKASFMHTADEGNDGTPRQGLLSSANYSLGWVNPDGYYVNQIGMGTSQVAGIGSTSDIRPISMVGAVGNDGYTGIAGVPNLGGIGPQDMRTYSLSGRYTFDINDDIKPTIFAEYAHSEYKPSKNSDYSVGGDALRAGMQFSLFNDKLNIEGSYNRVDPTYDPYILVYPTAELGNTLWSVPNFTYYSNLYSLHDTENYTHNRKGFRTKLAWKFCPTGQLQLSYSKLSQTKTSCQDVRYSAGSLGPFTPNSTVLGFSPGFVDPVFGGFSEETFASDGTNALGKVLENPRGHVENWVVGFGFKYPLNIKKDRRCIGLYGGARSTHFKRSSDLVNILDTPTRWGAQSQNYIDCYFNGWQIRADYDITTKLKINVNYKVADIFGHMDHLGVMNAYADAIHSTDFDILNVQQFIPSVGLDWQMSDQLTWGIMGQYYRTKDSMPKDVYATPAVPAVNIALPPQQGSHPFNWQGYMISSHIDYKF